MPPPLALGLATALAAIELVDAAAALLNLRSIRKPPPPGFEGLFDPEKYSRMQAYSAACTRFGLAESWAHLALILGFWLSGGYALLDGWVRGLGWPLVPTGLLFMSALFLGQSAVFLPFRWYSTFVLEEGFGFNRTTPRTFWLDLAKGLALAAAIGWPVLAVILFLLDRLGPWAWPACWAASCLFGLFMRYVYPTWIMPLFNKFTPLEEGELRRAILDYARSVDFPLANILVMDGSRRSSKTNAFFTGFGNNKRIALFDTLIKQHPVRELVAVLAHEIGHYKKKHILQGLLISWAESGAMFFLLGRILGRPYFFEAFYLRPSVYAGLVIFGLLVAPLSFVLSLGFAALSRRHELEADRFCAETLPDPGALAAALRTLTVVNLAPLTPHPFFVKLHYSHPPVVERVAALEAPKG
jgi:STE24 endopeptidase